jgi:hypothetical protein
MSEDEERTVVFQAYYRGQMGAGFSRQVARKIEMKETQALDELRHRSDCLPASSRPTIRWECL